MNPLLDPEAEQKFDAMIDALERAGYTWSGALCTSPNGYKFYGLVNSPFYMQVYMVYDHFMRLSQIQQGGIA